MPSAPLDHNVAERTLTMAILHRKNSLGYKTVKGAHVGDLFMSLIQTCRSNTLRDIPSGALDSSNVIR